MMTTLDTVQTFAGVTNENEFYSHHYLAEVFKGDIRGRIDTWLEREQESERDDDADRAPFKRLASWSSRWFTLRADLSKVREPRERLSAFADLQVGLLRALGYGLAPVQHEFVPGSPVLVWQLLGDPHKPPQLIVVPAYNPGQEEDDVLDQKLGSVHYDGLPVPQDLQGETWATIISDAIFGGDAPPRYVIVVGLNEWLLLDRYKWPNNRALRFDWNDILDRKDASTLQAAAALLHRESLAPDTGVSLLESLDENAHKHAFGVSEDLKYAIREAIETLGNEAARQLRQQATEMKKSVFSGEYELDAGQLSLECLRLVYRLLFMFYIEARPELSYVPIAKSDVYLKGYSLESLRDLERVPLNTERARNGIYFDQTLRRLFTLVAQGCGLTEQRHISGGKDVFALAPLDSRLFDDAALPLLNKVRFPNIVWQRVIRLMSESGGKGKRKGRVSYQLLSINQLGAVYEALLAYRGFFAVEDLYEVQPAAKKASKADDEADGADEDGDSDAEDAGSSTDLLDTAWFVPESRIGEYKPAELVHDVDEDGRQKLRKYPKGSFIYRLAGRDREKSASYYTPQVLTRCLVKYALKELLQDKTADDILQLTVCEPAMGSAAFLNEAVNQLSEAYLERKQTELNRRIPHDEYPRELQRVRMVLADRNVFGVDLNPIAVELAEVSLWLNAIYGQPDKDVDGSPLPLRPAHVPWFGYQLFTGNSLIGTRREVFRATSLKRGAKPRWYEEPPRRLNVQRPDRAADEIYHFLLPDPGMARYKDKVAQRLYPEHSERLSQWRDEFCRSLEDHELSRLQQLSARIDELWNEHALWLARDRARTQDDLTVWPAAESDVPNIPRREKEAIRRQGLFNEDGDLATPFRRLKLVMDYWCALWFWPIQNSGDLPTREQWWMEIGAILEGNIVDVATQSQIAFTPDPPPQGSRPNRQPDLEGLESQPRLAGSAAEVTLHDKLGQLRISRLRQHFPRVSKVEAIAAARRFMHWELCFSDVLSRRGGFDVVLGNPPWIKVEWNEDGILGETNPIFAIRKISASSLMKLRSDAFDHFSGLQAAWTAELEEAEGTQNFLNALQNYPVLQGQKVNLFKCFIPLAWRLIGHHGVVGYLHPEGPYDDPDGGALRDALYPRLRHHFQFQNAFILFPIAHRMKFSINIHGPERKEVAFDQISNLFVPATIDACYLHDGQGVCEGIKTSFGEWNIAGHRDRIVQFTDVLLGVFAKVFDPPGTTPRQARLPGIHTRTLVDVLRKFGAAAQTLGGLGRTEVFINSTDWNEKGAQDNGTIRRRSDTDNGFAAVPGDLILSGPHFSVANPIYQTPKRVCRTHGAYDPIDLPELPNEYLPRTNYQRACDPSIYAARLARVTWTNEHDGRPAPFTMYHRVVARRRLSLAAERTLLPAIIPPEVTHLYTVISAAFRQQSWVPKIAGLWASLPFDFYVKSIGKLDFQNSSAETLAIPDLGSRGAAVSVRTLALNCLTTHLAVLWNQEFDPCFPDQSWSQPENLRLPQQFFAALTSEWTRDCALRTHYARRIALIELDVLVSQALNLSLDQLLLMYRVQFPVMQQYERDTWYDISGRIVFTISRGLPGVGLPRKITPNLGKVTVVWPDGRTKQGLWGWDDIRAMWERGELPDGTRIERQVMDDTQPGVATLRTRSWIAPFALANREEDYRTAWTFFENADEDR